MRFGSLPGPTPCLAYGSCWRLFAFLVVLGIRRGASCSPVKTSRRQRGARLSLTAPAACASSGCSCRRGPCSDADTSALLVRPSGRPPWRVVLVALLPSLPLLLECAVRAPASRSLFRLRAPLSLFTRRARPGVGLRLLLALLLLADSGELASSCGFACLLCSHGARGLRATAAWSPFAASPGACPCGRTPVRCRAPRRRCVLACLL